MGKKVKGPNTADFKESDVFNAMNKLFEKEEILLRSFPNYESERSLKALSDDFDAFQPTIVSRKQVLKACREEKEAEIEEKHREEKIGLKETLGILQKKVRNLSEAYKLLQGS